MKRKRATRSQKMKIAEGSQCHSSDHVDRLSDLPDCILLHILSFMITKFAAQTCILSKRWRNLWKALPNLTLHTSDFSKHSLFSEFVSEVLSCRDSSYPLHKLDFHRHGYFQPQLLRRLMKYAVSHNLQQLRIYVPCNVGLPSHIFSCQSLTSLDISVSPYDVKRRSRIPKSLELPALVSLHLKNVALTVGDNGYAEPFSTCKKLNTLFIDCWVTLPPDSHIEVVGVLCISNATLANLTINNTSAQKTLVHTPNLSSFTLNGSPFQRLCALELVNVELRSCSFSDKTSKRGFNPSQHASSSS